MATSASWDLEKYKSEFESDEHWQLRKRFMEFHKDKYPEEKLVCLARVFCNVEFLGCRYPEKTMKLVAELSKGVADDYREKQKGKLKRTFVQASDAAGAKIKGSSAAPPNKIPKISENNPTSSGFKYTCFVHEDVVKLPPEGEFPGFIIYENCKTNCPLNILTQSAQKNKTWTSITFEFPAEKNPASNKERYCEVKLNKKVLSSAVGQTLKEAKVNAAIAGLNKLRQSCYTIQEKLSFFTDAEPVSKEKVVKGKEQTTPLPQDNIGSRMMMKMGWTGAGLGKKEQGIQAPIEASETMRRAGFGHLSTSQFHAKFRNVFKDYISSGSTNDLVFAPDFSSDERKILHKLAQSMNLKTKSYGKLEQRHLVVYKIMTLPDILETLLRCGGENEKYSLVYPQGVDSSSPSTSSSHVVVDKENSNVSVRIVPADSTKDNTMPTTTVTNSESQNISQPFQISKTNVCVQSGNCRPKHTNVPEITLSSDNEINSQENLKDSVQNKWISEDYTKIGEENEENEEIEESDDLRIINRMIQLKKDEISTIQDNFDELLKSYGKFKQFTKKERRKYIIYRRMLQNISGCFILNVLMPQWTIEDFKSGNIPVNDSLNDFNLRCEVAGMAEVENNNRLKNDILQKVKRKLNVTNLTYSKATRRVVRKEFQSIGSRLVSDRLYVQKEKSKSKISNKQNSESKNIRKKKITPNKKLFINRRKKTREFPTRKRNNINFVKETGTEFDDDTSGMEYSDVDDEDSDE